MIAMTTDNMLRLEHPILSHLLFLPLFTDFVFQLANTLRHRSHRTKCTPGTRPEENHGEQAQQQRSQHQAVKTEAELRHPARRQASRISPSPRHFDRPKQFNHFSQGIRPGKNQISLKYHVSEHRQKENQKSIPEPFR